MEFVPLYCYILILIKKKCFGHNFEWHCESQVYSSHANQNKLKYHIKPFNEEAVNLPALELPLPCLFHFSVPVVRVDQRTVHDNYNDYHPWSKFRQ